MTQTETMLGYLKGRGGTHVAAHRPWPRFEVNEDAWSDIINRLAVSDWSVVGLWGETGFVHLALRDEDGGEVAVVSLICRSRRFPSVAAVRPAALRLERAIQDLHGLVAIGLPDARPWLDHGRWPIAAPLSSAVGEPPPPRPYAFLPVEGEGVHQIPVGPVHAGIIEPGHFRFHCNGETVVRLEERLGYVHKGVEKLMEGLSPVQAAKFVARVSGDSTVAYSLAFARAVEAAAGIEAPPRAAWLRGLMAELERIANHIGDIGAICNDAAFALMLAHCGALRERVLRACDHCFGHRLMMDRIVPGGVAVDLSPEKAGVLWALVAEVRPAFARLCEIYDAETSLLDRTVATGVVGSHLVHRLGAGGVIGRASSRDLDARLSPSYPPYDDLEFEVPVSATGDVNARVWGRMHEVTASLGLVENILERLPSGPDSVEVPPQAGEGMALVEGFRGEILVWVRLLPDGRVARCHPRDPSWFQWPLLEVAIEGNIVADFPLCNKSFNCSYSGHDL
ncbi:MAG: nickel-dependent hydrogenase large subunit [Alphaproteobacteria bacterium]